MAIETEDKFAVVDTNRNQPTLKTSWGDVAINCLALEALILGLHEQTIEDNDHHYNEWSGNVLEVIILSGFFQQSFEGPKKDISFADDDTLRGKDINDTADGHILDQLCSQTKTMVLHYGY